MDPYLLWLALLILWIPLAVLVSRVIGQR
jgi:hypothetical protein